MSLWWRKIASRERGKAWQVCCLGKRNVLKWNAYQNTHTHLRWNAYRNKSQNEEFTLEKRILLQRIEPVTFWSWVPHSTTGLHSHRQVPALKISNEEPLIVYISPAKFYRNSTAMRSWPVGLEASDSIAELCPSPWEAASTSPGKISTVKTKYLAKLLMTASQPQSHWKVAAKEGHVVSVEASLT